MIYFNKPYIIQLNHTLITTYNLNTIYNSIKSYNYIIQSKYHILSPMQIIHYSQNTNQNTKKKSTIRYISPLPQFLIYLLYCKAFRVLANMNSIVVLSKLSSQNSHLSILARLMVTIR